MTALPIFSVTLHPADLVDGRPVAAYGHMAEPTKPRPHTRFGATSAKGVLAFVGDFASQHGEPCYAAVNIEEGCPPTGFRAATARLFYNLEGVTR